MIEQFNITEQTKLPELYNKPCEVKKFNNENYLNFELGNKYYLYDDEKCEAKAFIPKKLVWYDNDIYTQIEFPDGEIKYIVFKVFYDMYLSCGFKVFENKENIKQYILYNKNRYCYLDRAIPMVIFNKAIEKYNDSAKFSTNKILNEFGYESKCKYIWIDFDGIHYQIETDKELVIIDFEN